MRQLSQLQTADFFDTKTLQRVMNLDSNSSYANINRWLKNGTLIQLKKGLYVTGDYLKTVGDRQLYTDHISNILKTPSYISGEYILQKYSMLTESVFTITSVTRKKTGLFTNNLGTFTYAHIKDSLFTGYTIISKNGWDMKEATKAKALFDFLYFRLWRLPAATEEIVASYRLNLDTLTKTDLDELRTYVDRARMKKLAALPEILKKIRL